MNYAGMIASMILIWIGGFGMGMAVENYRTSPLRRIRKKYRAERKSAMR